MCIFTVKWKKLAEFQAFATQKRDNSKQDIQNDEYAESWFLIILESSAVEFLVIRILDGRLWEVKNSFPKSLEIIPCFIQVFCIDVSFIEMHPIIGMLMWSTTHHRETDSRTTLGQVLCPLDYLQVWPSWIQNWEYLIYEIEDKLQRNVPQKRESIENN